MNIFVVLTIAIALAIQGAMSQKFKCYQSLQVTCSGSRDICGQFEAQTVNQDRKEVPCSSGKCVKVTSSASDSGVTISGVAYDCLPLPTDAESKCYGYDMLHELFPEMEETLDPYPSSVAIDYDVDFCLCDENLCNG